MRSIKEIKDIAASGRNYTNWDLVLQLACDGSLTKDKLDSIVTDAIGIATNKSVKEVSSEGERKIDLWNKVIELLMFCEPNGNVVNGFRTQDIISQLRDITRKP